MLDILLAPLAWVLPWLALAAIVGFAEVIQRAVRGSDQSAAPEKDSVHPSSMAFWCGLAALVIWLIFQAAAPYSPVNKLTDEEYMRWQETESLQEQDDFGSPY